MDLHQLDILINYAGVDTSAMHDLVMQLDQKNLQVYVLRDLIEKHGAKLSAIQAWANDAKASTYVPAPPSTQRELPLGQHVADVGSLAADIGTYVGTIDPDHLTLANWAYYLRHPELWVRQGQMFTKVPKMWDSETGYVYPPGDLVNAKPDGAVFKPWAIER